MTGLPENVQVYRVGGAVRDHLLGLPAREQDWVVVGATPEIMQAAGFKTVGRDFPVFLHPETGEEYALARTERKTAPGYHGFNFHASPDVTLEEDLRRRDFTINAMAETPDGKIIDPYGGREDIQARRIRHVSEAFAEDPVRILRAAKFAARYHALKFEVAEETLALMRKMVAAGEVDALVPERVWQETRAALSGPHPQVFFEVLRACGALKILLPEIDRLFGVPQPEKWHPEIDTGVHTLMVLEQAAKLTGSLPARFAALVHDLGKGTTPKNFWPSHRGHEERGVKLIQNLCSRLRIPNDCRDLAIHVSRFHTHVHRAAELRADTLLKVLESIGAFRNPENFEYFLLACEADARGRAGLENREYPQAEIFRRAYAAAKNITAADVDTERLEGPAIGTAIHAKRVSAIKALAFKDRELKSG